VEASNSFGSPFISGIYFNIDTKSYSGRFPEAVGKPAASFGKSRIGRNHRWPKPLQRLKKSGYVSSCMVALGKISKKWVIFPPKELPSKG
jgi:hypothetical protein